MKIHTTKTRLFCLHGKVISGVALSFKFVGISESKGIAAFGSLDIKIFVLDIDGSA